MFHIKVIINLWISFNKFFKSRYIAGDLHSLTIKESYFPAITRQDEQL